jgi:L-rhamnose mutarotase
MTKIIAALALALLLIGCARPTPSVRRVASITQLRPEKAEYYKKLHADAWPGVLEKMKASGMQNCSIYLREIDGKLYLFAYFEYSNDKRKLNPDKAAPNAESELWGEETKACQMPLPGETKTWVPMEEVFHME